MDFDANASRRAEAIYQTRDMVEARRRTIEALRLTPGACVLDVGSGPGLFAEEMAQLVGPTGCVRGVDLSESMVEIARERCADKPWVDFQIADAVSLPFKDGGFDACVSVQTLEFVADVDAAFVDASAHTIPVLDTAYGPECFSFHLARMFQGVLAERTGLTQEELDAWVDDLREQGEAGAYFFAHYRYLFTADKPRR